METKTISHVGLLDRFSFWLQSIVLGVPLDSPKSYEEDERRDAEVERAASERVAGTHIQVKSYRSYTARLIGKWPDGSYFMGNKSFYRLVRDAFREKGLEHNISYQSIERDSNGRINYVEEQVE